MNQSSSEIEASDPDTTPTIFVKNFPFGCPGAPIHGVPHPSATAGSGVTPPGDSIWAPFHSQRDWEIAQWAKTHRVTSSAFSELLAIRGVWDINPFTYCGANTRLRSSTGLTYHIGR